jgi:hypothetical protein
MDFIATENQLEKIKSFMQTELLKRGFHAPITKFEQNGQYFEIESSNFQTTPVLFESIKVYAPHGKIYEAVAVTHSDSVTVTMEVPFSISLSARYTHFGGGSNGCDLFAFKGVMADNGVYDLQITR